MDFLRRKKKKRSKWFLENGSRFLKELIADCNGISNPIRMFSSDQIHFDLSCDQGFGSWYKGVIEGRPYAITKIYPSWLAEEQAKARAVRESLARWVYNDIVISARVSNHSGFLKLMGCCLEFPVPVVVFEYPENGVLNERASVGSEDGPLLPWNVRLKIAKEVAIAITYLHTAFPRIILHRHILPWNVLLDKNWTAKLTDFSCAITLPEGKSWIEVDRIRLEFPLQSSIRSSKRTFPFSWNNLSPRFSPNACVFFSSRVD